MAHKDKLHIFILLNVVEVDIIKVKEERLLSFRWTVFYNIFDRSHGKIVNAFSYIRFT